METRLVNPNTCRFIQSRDLMDPATVQDYADMMEQGVAFEPCKGIITTDGAILVYDGNHRGEAAKVNGSMLEVELMPGREHDAAWLAAGANTRHGLRRSKEDVAKAVKEALTNPRAHGKSDREIARHCGCDHKTVGKYRRDLEASGDIPRCEERTVTRNGTEYQMAIPLPDEPETAPDPPSNASPQVFDNHMLPTSGGVRDMRETLHDCPECNGQQTVFLRQWKHGIVDMYKIKCTDCGESWGARVHFERAKAHADKQRLQEVHEKHGLIPEPETVYQVKDGKNVQVPLETAACVDCGEEFQRPQGREDLSRCETCRFEHYRKIYHPNSGPEQAPEGVAVPCVECRQSFPLDRVERFNDTWVCADCLEKMAPGCLSIEVCDFCGLEFPDTKLYMNTESPVHLTVNICRTCAQKGLFSLSDPDKHVLKDYQEDNEKTHGTDEFWFKHSSLTHWQVFQRYQRYREESGKDVVEIYRLQARIRELEAEVEDLSKKRDYAIESYQKLRNGKEAI